MQISEEEKKAIEIDLKCLHNVMNNFEDDLCEQMQEKVAEIKQFIEKQSKEIEQLRIAYKLMEKEALMDGKEELEIKDKMIDEMAEVLSDFDFDKCCEKCFADVCDGDEDKDIRMKCIKEYFRKKVEEEK